MNRPEVQNKGMSEHYARSKPGVRHTNSQRGIAKVIRQNKRAEAEARQERFRKHQEWRGQRTGLSAADLLAVARRM